MKHVKVTAGPTRVKRIKAPPKLYFAYGSNLQVEQFFRRCPSAKRWARCTLPDYQLFFDGVADIRPQPGEVVEGAIYEITARCEAALDRYEGFPHLYGKAEFEVATPDGKTRKVMVYTMESHRVAMPSPDYEGVIREGFDDWAIPHDTLDAAVAEARAKGVVRLPRPQPRKAASVGRERRYAIPAGPTAEELAEADLEARSGTGDLFAAHKVSSARKTKARTLLVPGGKK